MAANRDLRLFLPFLLLVRLGDSSSQTMPSQVAGTSHKTILPLRPRGRGPDNTDYDELGEDPTPTPATSRSKDLPHCDYNPCLDEQLPCYQLAAINNCLCPGLSSRLEAPEAPVLKRLALEGSDVVVQWCAPYSVVTAYKVTVGEGWVKEFGMKQRRGAVGEVAAGAQVCVVAVNNEGDSAPSEQSCKVYQPPGDSSMALKAGLIGGALGFLLLLSLAILLWRLRARRKARI